MTTKRSKNTSVLVTLGLVGMILIFTFSLSFVRPPSPDPDHPFDTVRAAETLSRILGDERPHPIDSDANDAVRERLLTEIRALGFDPIVRDDFHCTNHFGGVCGRVQNVMFWAVPPTDTVTQGVVLMSHYDSVPAGPGAGDDGAGVAVGLEVARLLKGRDLPRPVLVLITDGEEIGLLGAESFVQTDPLATRIGSVVNVEARGVTGPVSMFQTSRPNSRDISAIAKTGRTAMANTLSSDIYDAMPNDTDLSRFLDDDAPRAVDATNFAFILGDSFYHTPGDNLANLDRGSLFHSGINALAAVEGFAQQSAAQSPETRRLYFDLLTRGVVSVPFWAGIAAIILGGALSLTALIKTSAWRGWRGWAVLPIALIAAGLASVGLSMGLGLIREAGAFAPAHPWALRGAQAGIAVLISALIAITLHDHHNTDDAVDPGPALKSWVWLAVLGAIGLVLFSGSIVIFVPALAVATLCALAALSGRKGLAVGFNAAAAVLFLITNLPLPGFALAALGADAAPFAALWAIPTVILIATIPPRKVLDVPLMGAGALALILIVTAALVPPYSVDAPRGVSIRHIEFDAGNYVQLSGRTMPPPAMTEQGAFTFEGPADVTLPAYNRSRWTRSAATQPDIEASLVVLDDQTENDVRRLSLSVNAPTADRLHLAPASRDALWTALSINGVEVTPSRWGVRVAGRSVREARIDIELPANMPVGQIAILRYGIGPDLADLAASRPDWVLPRQDGDVRVRLLNLD